MPDSPPTTQLFYAPRVQVRSVHLLGLAIEGVEHFAKARYCLQGTRVSVVSGEVVK
jgi:hypothetical protein